MEPRLIDDKIEERPAASILRMLGNTDMSLVLSIAGRLPQGAEILEIGPWLGGLSTSLAQFGSLHVLDNFVWTEAHANANSGVLKPGSSFLPIFESNMASAGARARIIECDIEDFVWDGGALDLCFIDAPRNAARLHNCLQPLSAALKPDGWILVKNGLNSSDAEMGAYIDALLGLDILKIEATAQPAWCNIAVLRPGPCLSQLATINDPAALATIAPLPQGNSDPWFGRSLTMTRLGHLALERQWQAVFARLAELPPSPENIESWDKLELDLLARRSDLPNWAALAVLMLAQNDTSLAANPPVIPADNVSSRLRSYWINNAKSEWRTLALDLDLLLGQDASAGFGIAADLANQIHGRRIAIIGTDPFAATIGAICAGAEQITAIATSPVSGLLSATADRFPHVGVAQSGDEVAPALEMAQVIITIGTSDDPDLARLIEAAEKARGTNLLLVRC